MYRRLVVVSVLSFAVALGWRQGVALPAVFVASGLLAVCIFWSADRLALGLVAVLSFGLGFGVMLRTEQRIYHAYEGSYHLQATVAAIKGTDIYLTEVACQKNPCPSGLILSSGGNAEPAQLGDRLRVTCSLEGLPTYQPAWRYWERGIIRSCLTSEALERQTITPYGQLLRFRARITSRLTKLFSAREAGLLNGILLGDTTAMPKSALDDFRRTGTTHIVALSGFNVTIILTALGATLLPWLGQRWSVFVGLGLVFLFVVLTGASASVTRAAVMAGAVQSARLLGRPMHADRLLLYVVLLMSIQNPWLLWHDLGFQLSMTSTFGLLQIRPALEQYAKWIPTWWEVRDNLLSTIAASIASAPLLLVTFSGWSMVSFLANVIVLPAIPVIMALGAFVLPFLWLPDRVLAMLTSPVDALLHAVISILHALASWPMAYVVLPNMVIACSICLSIGLVVFLYGKSQSRPS